MRNRNILVALLLVVGAGLAHAQDRGEAPAFSEVPGEMEFSGRVIVRPLQRAALAARGENAAEIARSRRAAQATLAHYARLAYEPLVDQHVLQVPAGSSENDVISHLMATGQFEYAEPDWTLYPVLGSNDPLLGSQWHHNSNRMNSFAAWDVETGSTSVTVGICDTGVESTHPDLLAHRKEGYNAVNRLWESQGGAIGPVHPHGTMTTGCAAANGNNGVGVSGIGWNLSHRMLRVSNRGSGSADMSTLIHAALTSIAAGDRVASVSYSGVTTSSVRTTATQIKAMGGLLVWAAGNDGANLTTGNRDADDVLVVGATTSGDVKASFSAYGPFVDLVAPGASVYTTTTGAGYASVSGTSFSTPLTAGLVALIWSRRPDLTPDQVETCLKQGCDDLGVTGVDNTYGYGRIDSYGALQRALGAAVNEPPTVTISSPIDGSIYTQGDSVPFSGAADDEGTNVSASISWTSDRDGDIGTGASFGTTTLSAGTHTVTASVTDGGGATGSDTVTVVVEAAAGSPPDAPSALAAQDNADGTADVTWQDNSGNETEIEIEREWLHKKGTWQATTSLIAPADAESYTDSPGSGTFRYRIRANNASGSSAWTGWVQVDVTGGGNGKGGGPKGNSKP